MQLDLLFPKEIKLYIKTFQDTLASVLGWPYIVEKELINKELLFKYISENEASDTMGFASDTLKGQDNKLSKISFSFKKHIDPFLSNDFRPNKYLAFLHQMLIGNCWEIMNLEYEKNNSIELKLVDDPVIQFCRHIRNGCFHGNKFNLINGHPKLVSQWYHLIITKENNNKKIFADGVDDGSHFLNWGDALRLLYDVSWKVYRKT